MINKNVSFLNVLSVKSNLLEYKCPSCGNACTEKTKKCELCGYDLKDYRNIMLSKYNYFNESIDYINKKNYFNALLSINSFLTFCPNDEKGNEVYIYLLYKNKRKEEYEKQLEIFEKKFKYSSFIIDVEEKGIEKYHIPQKFDIDIECKNNSFDLIVELYNSSRFKTINEILDLEKGFFDIIQYNKDNKKEKKLQDFYDKRFLQFLSKFEIFVDSMDGKKYDDLSDDDKKKLEVIGEGEAVKRPVGTIITTSPAIYLRGKLLSKEKVIIVRKSKRW